jgi:hypothetical protein
MKPRTAILFLATATTLVLGLAAPSLAQGSRDFVVPAGTVAFYDTAQGPLRVERFIVEADAELRVLGARPLVVLARRSIEVHGALDLSGFDAKVYASLGSTLPATLLGAPGGPGAGAGGDGSAGIDPPPAGAPGAATAGGGGGGGESALALSPAWAGSGGGGALAANPPMGADPTDIGLVATAGTEGSPGSIGALTGASPARGGAAGQPAFADGDAENDFFGRKHVPGRGIVRGELALPVPGAGGGAGGDVSSGGPPSLHQPGNGGGGGGGLGVLVTARLVIGPGGIIRSDGGRGAPAPFHVFLEYLGGSSGGGSGGFLVLSAEEIDLSQADARCLTALGGPGGEAATSALEARGGNGGPGVIQLHVPPGRGHLLLPPGRSLADLSAPSAHVLLPLGAGGRWR